MVANEVLDVVPVHLVHWTADGPMERCVALAGAGIGGQGIAGAGPSFAWVDRPITERGLSAAIERLPIPATADGYLSEVAPAAAALAASLVERLQRGVALFIDYGFGRAEFYHPQRRQGTLMCHYRQHAHTDPFFLPGLQDITAHVDFTAIAEAAVDAGGRLAGYTTQAHFLLDAGIAGLLGRTPADQPGRYLPQAAAAQRLLSPAEMGELFKVMTIARGCDLALPGLGARDLSRLL
jgi:SAM-dependent MidA family methyltransferase